MAKEQAGPKGFTMEEVPGGPESVSPMTFSTLVLSISTTAMVHLGASPGPEAGDPPEVSLPLARQSIDMLEMLAEKTRGNLQDEEESLLRSLLHEVHLRYVEAHRSKK